MGFGLLILYLLAEFEHPVVYGKNKNVRFQWKRSLMEGPRKLINALHISIKSSIKFVCSAAVLKMVSLINKCSKDDV